MNLPDTKKLILEHQGSVLTIWMNRPHASNSLSAEMAGELIDVFNALNNERKIRTIILRGKGGMFCAGGDIKGFKSDMQGDMDHAEVAIANRQFGHLMTAVNEASQVVIILVEGAAIGGGLGLAVLVM